LESLKKETKLKGTPIDELKAKAGQEIPYKKIIFPYGKQHRLESWRGLLLSIVSWLVDTGWIKREDIPIATPASRKRYILNTEPKHKDGTSFKDSKKLGPYYVEANIAVGQLLSGASIFLRNTMLIPLTFFYNSSSISIFLNKNRKKIVKGF